ncbi:hypothetical protein ACFYPC_14765 [Streptomyces sp. NPDC005808]|uniref:hypothetical protein n=1 Tax=Streptomyces sp. NPDC005808 TaxID=3364734 RepID=UPI0036C95567
MRREGITRLMFFLYLLPRLPREISLAVFGLVVGLFLAVHGGMQAYAESTGVPGTVHVTDCTYTDGAWYELWTEGWACEGPFDADDRTVHIDSVAVDGILESHPDTSLAALVDGPGANTAAQDSAGAWKLPAITAAVILAFTAWRIPTLILLFRQRRVVRAAAVAAAVPA